MLQVDNKFEIGQEVYVIRKERTKEICPACNNQGHIVIDGNLFSCVTCCGLGRVYGERAYHVVGKNVIDRIKTSSYLLHNGTDEIKTVVKYAFKNGDDYTDAKLFLTEEEAEARCKELNEKSEVPKLNTSPLGSDVIEETFWQKDNEEE